MITARAAVSAASDWAILAYLGPIQVGLAYVLMTMGVRHVPALESSMILLAEPALNPIWTATILQEIPGPLPLLGGALILGGTLARVAMGYRRSNPVSATEAILPGNPHSGG